MKKYIRTNDGFMHECVEHDERLRQFVCKKDYLPNYYYIHDLMVDKEGDTIEELCDEFIICKDDEKPIVGDGMERFDEMKLFIFMGMIVAMDCWMKLANWTNTGLRYVARLNKEGEFELL